MNNPHAFPIVAETHEHVIATGMTMRDYFAAKAMAGLMNVYWDTVSEHKSGEELVKCQCETAYEYADAMLAEREK